jgi:hypothetical protein
LGKYAVIKEKGDNNVDGFFHSDLFFSKTFSWYFRELPGSGLVKKIKLFRP